MLAKDIYSQHFRAAQAVPRGVVAKLCAIVKQLETACEKHCCQVSHYTVGDFIFSLKLSFKLGFIPPKFGPKPN